MEVTLICILTLFIIVGTLSQLHAPQKIVNQKPEHWKTPVSHLDINGLLNMEHDEKWAIEIAKLQEGGNRNIISISSTNITNKWQNRVESKCGTYHW